MTKIMLASLLALTIATSSASAADYAAPANNVSSHPASAPAVAAKPAMPTGVNWEKAFWERSQLNGN